MPKDEIREEDKKCSSKFVSLALFLRTHACHFQKNNLVYNAQWSKKWKKVDVFYYNFSISDQTGWKWNSGGKNGQCAGNLQLEW